MEALIIVLIIAILYVVYKKYRSIGAKESVKPAKQYGCGTFLVLLVGGLLLIGYCAGPSNTPAPAKIPEQTKAEKEKIDKQARAIAGVHIMQKIVPDPERLKITSAILTAKGDVCYEFRFPNASGGISIQKAVLPANGDRLIIPLDDAFRKNWNSLCKGKNGDDVKDYLEIALKH